MELRPRTGLWGPGTASPHGAGHQHAAHRRPPQRLTGPQCRRPGRPPGELGRHGVQTGATRKGAPERPQERARGARGFAGTKQGASRSNRVPRAETAVGQGRRVLPDRWGSRRPLGAHVRGRPHRRADGLGSATPDPHPAPGEPFPGSGTVCRLSGSRPRKRPALGSLGRRDTDGAM